MRVLVKPRLQTERWSLYWREAMHTETKVGACGSALAQALSKAASALPCPAPGLRAPGPCPALWRTCLPCLRACLGARGVSPSHCLLLWPPRPPRCCRRSPWSCRTARARPAARRPEWPTWRPRPRRRWPGRPRPSWWRCRASRVRQGPEGPRGTSHVRAACSRAVRAATPARRGGAPHTKAARRASPPPRLPATPVSSPPHPCPPLPALRQAPGSGCWCAAASCR
jgi:hypothetical protein